MKCQRTTFVDVREVKDPPRWKTTGARVSAIVEEFRGRYVVIGRPFQVLEGSYQPVFPVMIEFPSMLDARRWYDSDQYRGLKPLRLASTVSNAFFMEGTPTSR